MSKLLDVIKNTMSDKKGNDVTVIDFAQQNPLFDYFVICDAPSLRQINAIADAIIEAVEYGGFAIKHVERKNESTWILIDAIDVVAHIFLSEDRHHYNLEKLYQEYTHERLL